MLGSAAIAAECRSKASEAVATQAAASNRRKFRMAITIVQKTNLELASRGLDAEANALFASAS
jgi:hypothetical protein